MESGAAYVNVKSTEKVKAGDDIKIKRKAFSFTRLYKLRKFFSPSPVIRLSGFGGRKNQQSRTSDHYSKQ